MQPPTPSASSVGCLVVAPPAVLVVFLPRLYSLRLLPFCTCPPLCTGAQWLMPAWVWRDVLFFSLISPRGITYARFSLYSFKVCSQRSGEQGPVGCMHMCAPMVREGAWRGCTPTQHLPRLCPVAHDASQSTRTPDTISDAISHQVCECFEMAPPPLVWGHAYDSDLRRRLEFEAPAPVLPITAALA